MNILIYIPELDQSWGGVRQYAITLIRILTQDKLNTYFVYHNSGDTEVLDILSTATHLRHAKDSDVAITAFQNKVIRAKQISNFVSRRLKTSRKFEFASVIDRIIDKYRIDVIHCPYQFIPATAKAKLIVTLHDVQEIHFPDFFTAEARAHRAVHFLDYLRRADAVVVSYQHVKDDLIKYFSVDSTNIHVILLDMGKLWFERFTDKDIISASQLNLTTPFIFYPANTWKHKNHVRLLQAVALLKDEYECIVNLVCSGHTNDHYKDVVSVEVDKLGIQNQVNFLGVVEEQVLYSLYHQCLGVVVPTIYEAGSFPLMESILLGIPVICSTVTSLPETVGDEDFLFDPLNTESIAAKIMQLWTSEVFRQQSVANSLKISPKLRHTDALRKFQTLYAVV